MFKKVEYIFTILVFLSNFVFAQKKTEYINPIIHADYSDPDAIRVGNDYYMVASSFNAVPALPILHSTDLVNWKIINYGLQKLIPENHFDSVQHGGGVWAPSIRFHNNEFYIFYPDPDFGIYVIKAKKVTDQWSEPVLVEAGKGLIDPCPLWDDDGKVYLTYAFAGSRAEVKSILVISEMNKEATQVISDPIMVYDGNKNDPTIEGPKMYKRNGYYYIFAPGGGVATGWQTVLRSKKIYGPYERKIVLEQGNTKVNGPHQGAWVTTQSGEDWFLHFQDKAAYGRIVHLQPVQWKNDWPLMGEDQDGNGIGEPIMKYKAPKTNSQSLKGFYLSLSDEFNGTHFGLQWQWQSNKKINWAYCYDGALRLYTHQKVDSFTNIWNQPNLLMQKFPAEKFEAVTKVKLDFRLNSEQFGFTVFGLDYAYVSIKNKNKKLSISYTECKDADKRRDEKNFDEKILSKTELFIKLIVTEGGKCNFSYSDDGINFISIGNTFIAREGKWVGAKFGFFAIRNEKTNNAGFAEIDWIRVERR